MRCRLLLLLGATGLLACGVRGSPRPPRPEAPSVGGPADASTNAEIPSGGSALYAQPDAGLPGNAPAAPVLP